MKAELKNLKNVIHTHNEYYRVAAPILEHIKEVCKQFIGKKIETQKGLSAKFYEAIKINRETIDIKPIPGAKWANLHFTGVKNSYNDLSVEISLCFSNGDTGCTYEARSWYFGKTENGILVSINDNYKVPVSILDYETELAAIKEFRKLEKLAETAEEKINVNREAYKYISLEDLKNT